MSSAPEPLARWGELLVEAARTRVQKRKAASDEDFAAAGRLKRREAELAAAVDAARAEAAAAAPGSGASDEERRRLEEAKRKAVAEEDFAEAGRLKKRLQALGSQGAGAEDLARQAQARALELAAAAADAADVARELQAAAAAPAAAPASAAAPAPAPAPAAVPGPAAAKLELGAKREGPRACSVPGVTAEQLLAMSNQELWQAAWEATWQKADAAGLADDQQQVYAKAQKVWKAWIAERDRLGKDAEGDAVAPAASAGSSACAAAEAGVKAEEQRGGLAEAPASADWPPPGGLTQEHREAQEEYWAQNKSAAADWKRAQAEAERRRAAKEGGGEAKSSRDLCAVVKMRCPADQPLQFERLLAVCPAKTTVKQLVQAMAKEPQEFRQNFDGSEFCVRPVNSRCTDWLPVQSTTTPPGFRDDASLPESMLNVAKQIFEERLRPQGQAAEDPLAQFLAQPGRVPPDSPMPFADLLSRCPPGTKPLDLVRTMSKRRDVFRQDPEGALFCVRPRTRCRDWGAVNPYADPMALPLAAPVGGADERRPAGGAAGGGVVGGPMVPASECEDGEY